MAGVDLPKPDVPEDVAIVRDFVNTTDFETGADELGSRAALATYLRAAGLSPRTSRASEADLALAHRLRAGLRHALELNHEGTSSTLPHLDAAVRALPIGLEWGESGAVLRPTAGGVPGALARIGLAAQACAVDGTWERLKICASDECGWAYFDHSKNRSRSWCEYGCGNKIKTRAYRERRRSALSP